MPRTRSSVRRSRSRAASTMPAASARSRSSLLASTSGTHSSSRRSAANRSASSRTELGALATTRAADRTRPASCSNAGEVIGSGYKDQVISMDDDLAAATHPLGGLLRVHPDQALGEDHAVGARDLHRIARAGRRRSPRRRRRRAASAPARSTPDVRLRRRPGCRSIPVRRRSTACGPRAGSSGPGTPSDAGFVGQGCGQDPGPGGIGDHRLHARPGGDLRRGQLRSHAAAAQRRSRAHPPGDSSCWSISTTSSMSDASVSRRGSAVRSPGVSVSRTRSCAPTRCATSAASRSLSPKRISSSATASFSLTTGTTPRAARWRQRPPSVQVLRAVDEVERCQQHLPGQHSVRLEAVLPHPHQAVLAHGRHRLQDGGVRRPPLAAIERLPSCGDGARRHHDDGVPRRAGRRQLLRTAGGPSRR